MISKWADLKEVAIAQRMRGASVRDIEKKLGIPRSTLSGWFKNTKIPARYRERLRKRWEKALRLARKKAVLSHNTKKAERIEEAKLGAQKTLVCINTNDVQTIELALALLYLGEGSKKAVGTIMGNSDPLILNFFISALQRAYSVPLKDIKCELHLRADQNSNTMKKYWSKALGVPLSNFGASVIDFRTKGTKTYPHYKGVCVVRCSRVAIQRKLLYIARGFCEGVSNMRA